MKKATFTLGMLMCFFVPAMLTAQTTTLTLDLTKPGVSVSPRLYGLMTEEINHSYDGGLYAELIRNRIFKDNPTTPEGWSAVQEGGAKASIQLVGAQADNVPRDQQGNAINNSLTTCLKLIVENADGRAGIANEGFWGIPVRPQTSYKASFYIKGTGTPPPGRGRNGAPATPPLPVIADNTPGPITVSIESNDGKTVYASGTINLVKSIYWKKYELTLTTAANFTPTAAAHFVISTNRTGLYYFNLVSLFPPTYHNRPNGNRIDIMQMMADMKPTFLRFPGGNFLEGPYLADQFPWKTTLGILEERPGHAGSWGYRASDGMGLLEFLEWCEDLKIEPLLAVYAGYSLRGDHVDAGPLLKSYVDDALDEIEYVTGDIHTKWGARRAADGHAAPFKLTDIEIGNEDWFDRSNSYDGRFNQFRAAIKAKYPRLRCISTIPDNNATKVTTLKPEMVDEHYYRPAWQMEEDAGHYDKYDRAVSPKIFVGEWATREGAPTTNMNAALGDAAWMTGMERNSDILQRSCYAPLFVNVNVATPTTPRAWQWDSDLIGYNTLTSFGCPSYYAQKMFNTYLGNKVIATNIDNLPMQGPATRDTLGNSRRNPNSRPKAQRPSLFYVATQDTKTGAVYLKVVNTSGNPQPVTLSLKALGKISPEGTLVVLKSASPDDTNTIDNPEKIIPVTSKINDISSNFTQTFDPYSINVLQLRVIKTK
jgi:alpha-N-arabinofuranosidase